MEIQVEVQLIKEVETERVSNQKVQSAIIREVEQWRILFEPKYIRQVIIGVTVMVFQRELELFWPVQGSMLSIVLPEWSGVNALLYYAPTLIRSLGFNDERSDEVVLILAGFVSITQFFAVGPAISLIDTIGAFTTVPTLSR
jgi:hypothetical protein